MISAEIFRSYDVRGIYPGEVNEDAAFAIGVAFVKYTGAKTIAVGRDMRLSSQVLFDSLCKGIIQSGCDVYDLGQGPTEILYFAVGGGDYDAGIMITASHNPKEYNGFKLIKKEGKGFSMVRGKDLYALVSEDNFIPEAIEGDIKTIDLRQDYVDYCLSLFSDKDIKPFKVVIDAGNGMAATIMPLLQGKLPLNIAPINFNIDGNFPAHPSNPLEEGAARQASEAIKKEGADFGFIFDGDADRIFLLDETGNFVAADATILLLAKYVLEKNPGAGIVYNTICSKSVPEIIQKLGGKAIKSQVGFVNVREAAIKNNGLMGGELSGHFCFKENFFGDSGLIAFLILNKVISSSSKKVSELVKDYLLYEKSAEINFQVKDKDLVLNKIKEKYSDAKQEFLDGITIDYGSWWFNIRPSNTEQLLRLTIEAPDKNTLEAKKKEITELIASL